MAASATIYDYTPLQARIVELYDCYRTSLMNAKYYARRLDRWKLASTISDGVVAISASGSFGSMAFWKQGVGANTFTVLLSIATLLSVLRPVLRIPDKIDHLSKLHYGYLELYYRIEALISEMRTAGRVSPEQLSKADALRERFRSLELEGDAYQSPKILLKYQDEIEKTLPTERLWLPSE